MMTNLRSIQMFRLIVCLSLLCLPISTKGDVLPITVTDHPWEQVARERGFTLAVERQTYSQLDGEGRIVLAVQVGRGGPLLEQLTTAWSILRDGAAVASGERKPIDGLVCVDFDLRQLAPGRYDVTASLVQGDNVLEEKKSFFEVVSAQTPATSGRVPIVFPQAINASKGAVPVTFGMPMPKGALRNSTNVRVVRDDGAEVPAQLTVRGKWGHGPAASVRWLGVDMQVASVPAWWPKREEAAYYLEFGPEVRPAPIAAPLRVELRGNDFFVDTGKVSFFVRQSQFNLLDQVTLDGRTLPGGAGMGPYLIDHEGATYRAANDGNVKLTLEESGPLRAVIRAEGWYVKDGTDGLKQNFTLPTDKLCRFITRIEVYAGQASVRVLHTWIITYDSFSVRLRDVGIAIPAVGAQRVRFGVEDAQPIVAQVPAGGVHLIQHRPDRFDVEAGDKSITSGERSDGNALLTIPGSHMLGVAHRDTWQRFPKEIEVLPDELRLHIWPAHGRTQPKMDVSAPDRYHQLWWAHQGRELDMTVPWDVLYSVIRETDNPSMGIYKPAGTAMGGVHASAMGAAITSDFMIQFATPNQTESLQDAAHHFQQQHHALAHPQWLADSGALGRIHPYDPEKFEQMESVAQSALYSYRDLQNDTGEYGMFLYRTWHHGRYIGNGKWEPYRLYNAAHHYEPYMPWLYYARSGDPALLGIGMANARHLSDLSIIHHADPRYDHQEFYARQGRLVGSTRHTNGFVSWGGDHAVFGHLTCYNGLLLSYYLTGDLRQREVVVDEWQHTIVADRGNPQMHRASRLTNVGRDNNNSLGELIDLYQLTYDPRLLAHIAPALDRFLTNMMTWGMPLDNVLNFNLSQQATAQLREALMAWRTEQNRSLHHAFNGHSPGHSFALAAMLFDEPAAASDALMQVDLGAFNALVEKISNPAQGTPALCQLPDTLVYLPTVMAAAAQFANQTGDAADYTVQSLPIGGAGINANFTRIVVRQANDAPFTINLRGSVQSSRGWIQVLNPAGEQLINESVPAGHDPAYTIAADGMTGEYVIFLRMTDAKDHLIVPITSLPGEVYVTAYWSQDKPGRYFTRAGNLENNVVSLTPHKAPGRLHSGDLSRTFATTNTGETIAAAVDPDQGMWVDLRARYISVTDKKPLVLSVTPSRHFTPSESSMSVKPPRTN